MHEKAITLIHFTITKRCVKESKQRKMNRFMVNILFYITFSRFFMGGLYIQ